MSGFRTWMYDSHDENGNLKDEFIEGVKIFLEFAFSSRGNSSGGMISCPCSRCCNTAHFDHIMVNKHLYRWGFMHEYFIWISHGETDSEYGFEYEMGESSNSPQTHAEDDNFDNAHIDMINDAFPQFSSDNIPEEPNPEAQKYYDLFRDAHQPVWPGHNKTLLEWVSEIMCYKTGHRVSQAAVEKFIKSGRSMAPVEHQHLIPDSYRKVKNIMKKLGLTVIKYDVCENNCFLYYKDGEALDKCPVCGKERYEPKTNEKGKNVAYKKLWYFPITERLQRLYMSRKTAEHMTWHKKCPSGSSKVIHPAGSEAWKHVDSLYPEFADETRNVRLGLSSDGFVPNKAGRPHSIWPVFLTPYNLPPDLCMRQEFIFLSLIISGPKSPGNSIDVMLRPLIDELKKLWVEGALTYDCFKQQNFMMRAILLWTINDFPAYGMLSGWSTHGRLACPCCMETTDSFRLEHGQKHTWFDCHRKFLRENHRDRFNKRSFIKDRVVTERCRERLSGEEIKERVDKLPETKFGKGLKHHPGFGKEHNWVKRCIFWELPYWPFLLIRHNLDIMHNEKNVFQNIKCTVFEDPKSSKDNLNARKDLKEWTTRTSLFLRDTKSKPKATYTMSTRQRQAVCHWLKDLRFPDNHASNISNQVSLDTMRVTNLKSHDCHVFLQRLLPIAFRDILPEAIWEALTEVSNFFRTICATEIIPSEMEVLEETIVETICKLEKIFPPAFFDSMEHLMVHLPYEARVGGPVFYRWMYPFERKMWVLKNTEMNKNRLEGSICEAYLMTEVTNFCSFYFGRDVDAPPTRLRRNEDEEMTPAFENQLSVLVHDGKSLGKATERELSSKDFNAAILYLLTNCEEAQPYIRMFENQCGKNLNANELEYKKVTGLVPWFTRMVREEGENVDPRLVVLVCGAHQRVDTYDGYLVNGFRFHTKNYGRFKKTMCSGVCVKTDNGDGKITTYYGMLKDVIEISFYGVGFPTQKTCLFKCDWYEKGAVTTHRKYGLIDVDSSKKWNTAEPFILASQALQVYYSEYPSSKLPEPSREGIWAVCPIRARHMVDISSIFEQEESEVEQYQYPNPPPVHHDVDNSTFDTEIELVDHQAGLVEDPDDEGITMVDSDLDDESDTDDIVIG